MADGRDQSPGFSYRTALPWMSIFRCFQVALDPRKLFVAAIGILAMSFLWWLLSSIFYYKAPDRNDQNYSNTTASGRTSRGRRNPATQQLHANEELEPAVTKEAQIRFDRDYAQWQQLDALAGPGGRLRTLPWYEYRGPNPFLFFTDALGGTAADRKKALDDFWYGSVPVLVEPLVKLLLPVAKIVSPGVSSQTRLYLFLVLLSNVAVWAFCGGVITRLAAVQLANKGPVTFMQAVRFVSKRYLSYLGAPLVPLGIIAAVVIGLVCYGLVALIPVIGDVVLLGIGLPAVIVGGAIMTVFLVGLVGYPMMYTTLSAEGDQSDTFDALSRSINYVYQSPWHYIWYWLVAVVYGAAVTFFVLFFTSLMVYMGKWAVGPDREPRLERPQAGVPVHLRPGVVRLARASDHGQPVRGPGRVGGHRPRRQSGAGRRPAKGVRQVYAYTPVNAETYANNRGEFYAYNTWGAGIVCFWLTLAFLLMLGFSYSFFWSAATMIYLLMRKRVDEAELDEVYEDEEPEPPLAPPKLAPAPAAGPSAAPRRCR